MNWSDNVVSARRRGLDTYEWTFVIDRAGRGYPARAIAKMLGRAVEDVLPFMPADEPDPAPVPVPAIAPPAASEIVSIKPLPKVVKDIVIAVARRRGLCPSDILGPSRLQATSHARQEVMWELHRLGRFSLHQIGGFMGRDHTTVLTGARAHEKRWDL